MKNAGEVLERVVGRHHQGLRAAAKALDQQHIASLTPCSDASITVPVEAQAEQRALVVTSRQPSSAQQRRRARYQDVLALAAQGLGPTAIGSQVGLTRQTVAIWLQARTLPERPPSAPRRMLITPYERYLRERWEAGCQNSRQLWREVQANGFTGGDETVRRLIVRWRTERGWSEPPRRQPASSLVTHHRPSAVTRPLSPRQVHWLLRKPEDERKPEQQAYLKHVEQDCPEVVVAKRLIVEFIRLVREREVSALEGWLVGARASGLPELVEFAKGLMRDRCAVEGALRYTWSNGVTEGHVNRLKMIKRTSYGRASFTLLRQRVLAQV